MENKTTFQRNFFIFNVEDTGYDTGQKLSGHVRMEIREGRGKLWMAVQNLNTMEGRLCYKLYMIRVSKGMAVAVCPGVLSVKHNRAELEWEFDPQNVHKSGIKINDFELFAVLAEYADKNNIRLICPLAAYRDKKVEWRNTIEGLIYRQKSISEKAFEKEVVSMYPGKMESKYIPPETKPEFNSFNVFPYQNIQHPAIESTQQYKEESFEKDSEYNKLEPAPEDVPNREEEAYQENEDTNRGNEEVFPQNESVYHHTEEAYPKNEVAYTENKDAFPMDHEESFGNDEISSRYEKIPVQAPYIASPVNSSRPDSKCLYMNGNMCGMYLSPAGVNPCNTCSIHAQASKASEIEEKRGDLVKLKGQLERNFEPGDPFHSKRSDYKWWKVSNPVNLNNILYQCNIRSPLLFNPMVMMAHFKYRHLIIGIYTDKVRKREYVVCGVPGMNMVDKRPFGELCKWIQAEGNRPRYGAFGYWIVYIDPGTGKILSLK